MNPQFPPHTSADQLIDLHLRDHPLERPVEMGSRRAVVALVVLALVLGLGLFLFLRSGDQALRYSVDGSRLSITRPIPAITPGRLQR